MYVWARDVPLLGWERDPLMMRSAYDRCAALRPNARQPKTAAYSLMLTGADRWTSGWCQLRGHTENSRDSIRNKHTG